MNIQTFTYKPKPRISQIHFGFYTMCSGNEKSKVGFSEMEIDEWNLQLRMNNISMDEHNVGVRILKIGEFGEQNEARYRHDRERINEERERTNQEKERSNLEREIANDDREWTNNLRELVNDERELKNKERERAIMTMS